MQQCLNPWCKDIDLLNKSEIKSMGSYSRKISGKNLSLASDTDLSHFVSQQLEMLIMRISNSAELLNTKSLHKLLTLYSNTLSGSSSSSSHIVRDRLQYICLTVLQKERNPITKELMQLLEASRLNTELFVKIDVMNAADDGNSEYIEEKIYSDQQQYEKILPKIWMKKELLASFANKGDVESLLSSIETLNTALDSADLNETNQYKTAVTSKQIDNSKKQHDIFLKQSIKRFLENCTDINLAFVMMDKLLRSVIGQKVCNYGHFLTMIDIGIENPSPKSHWFQIKNLLQLLLNIPNRAITDIIIYDKLIKYCLVHQDIVGLTDALQMLFDWKDEIKQDDITQKLSSQLFEEIMEFVSNKSSDAALHLFEKLLNYSEQPSFKCLYWVLKSCADVGDEIGLETVKDLMITNNITQNEWDLNIYNAIIKCNSFKGDLKIKDSLYLFKQLLEYNLIPNISTFNALLSHHKYAKDNSDIINVEFILNQIEDIQFYVLKPSQDTFSIILEYCAKHKHKQIANKLLNMIHELPNDDRLKVINDKSVWLHYLQCFDSYQEIVDQINTIFTLYKGIGANLLTNDMIQHFQNVIYDNDNNDNNQHQILLSDIVLRMRNMETLIDILIENYNLENNVPITLEMTGYCKVFDVIYMMNKSDINQNNIESAIYTLSQIDTIFWRFMDKMKEINIFFPDPDLLKPYLYLKDILLQCHQLSSSSIDNQDIIFDGINDGIFRFIEYGVFVSSELIVDLCDHIEMTNTRKDKIIQRYDERRKHQQDLRRKQPLPHFSY